MAFDPIDPNVPFKRTLSFDPILGKLEELAKDMPEDAARMIDFILAEVRSIPQLTGPIQDLSVLDEYPSQVKMILESIFPRALSTNEIKACLPPWNIRFFNKTQRFQKILDEHGNEDLRGDMLDPEQFLLSAYWTILNVHYNARIKDLGPAILKLNHASSGLTKYYKALGNGDLMEILVHGKLKPIDKEIIDRIRRNPFDVELIESSLDASQFEFYGLWLMTLVDMTREMSLSNLKQNLLKNNALQDDTLIKEMESDLHNLMSSKEFSLGFADMKDNPGNVFDSHFGRSRMVDIFKDHPDLPRTIPEIAVGMIEKKPVVVPCVHTSVGKTRAGKLLLGNNIRSLLMAPLVHDGEKIGFFELTSPNPDEFSLMDIVRIDEVIPIFKTAMIRSIEEHDNRVEAIIKENFTSIHPSVHWKFQEIAEDLLLNERSDEGHMIPDISFNDVIPLFGQADIRHSSNLRNDAIQSDMIKELGMVLTTLDAIAMEQDMPVVSEMRYRVEQQLTELQGGLKAGDEAGVNDLLREVVQPLLRYFVNNTEIASEAVQAYFNILDEDLGILYDGRKSYEQSVALINQTISDIISDENQIAQNQYPHYFEKYKTDGVEYNAYIGASISPNHPYNPVYLRNLRLWQLIVMCKVSRATKDIQSVLEVKMDVAPLILVHNAPLSIKFRMDEKKFDVDGTYNIRYEIIKKRIDKATIKGKDERLTEPGKLSIVFSQDREAEEYLQYIDYLKAKGMLSGDVERINLENMPGAAGLEALRADIVTEGDSPFVKDVMQMVND